MIDRTALVVLSGGQDSTICLLWALRLYARVRAITFNYGQRHIAELRAARCVAHLAGLGGAQFTHHEFVEVGPILAGSSPLTDHTKNLERYQSFEQMDRVIGDRVELTFVPMRNALFLTLAANRAALIDGGVDIITGVCQADNANYPDCRGVFIDAQRLAINAALGADSRNDVMPVNILTPLLDMTKADSVLMAHSWGLYQYSILAYSHTAYDGSYPPRDDHASVLRAHGFAEAKLPDPLIARAVVEGQLFTWPLAPGYEQEQREPLIEKIAAHSWSLQQAGLV